MYFKRAWIHLPTLPRDNFPRRQPHEKCEQDCKQAHGITLSSVPCSNYMLYQQHLPDREQEQHERVPLGTRSVL